MSVLHLGLWIKLNWELAFALGVLLVCMVGLEQCGKMPFYNGSKKACIGNIQRALFVCDANLT